MQEFVASAGWAAAVVFVVAYALGTVALVPGAAMTALAGVLVVGTGLVVAGATIGATAAFGLSRMAARPYVAATALGIVPGAFAYASVGGTAGDPLSARFVGAVALVVALSAAGVGGKRFLPTSAVPAPPGGGGQGERGRGDEQQRQR